MGIGAACQQQIAHCVGAGLVDQVVERVENAAPRAHAYFLAVAHGAHQLVDDDVNFGRVVAERG